MEDHRPPPHPANPPRQWILPIYRCSAAPGNVWFRQFMGTGFVLSGGVFVTCAHCVPEDALAPGEWYAARRGHLAHGLTQLERDLELDTATAKIDVLGSPLTVAAETPSDALGIDVWTYGFPGTLPELLPTGTLTFHERVRYLEGYITTVLEVRTPGSRRIVPLWEVDMPGPEGISGAPLIQLHGTEIIGMVYRRHVVHGERSPGLDGVDQRLVDHVFSLALHTTVLNEIRGRVLGGHTLREYLDAVTE